LRNAAVVSRRRVASRARKKKVSLQMGLAFVAVEVEEADLTSGRRLNTRCRDCHMEVPLDKWSIKRAIIHGFCL
jgi:cytochrome c2